MARKTALTEETITAKIAAVPEAQPDEWDKRMLEAADRNSLDPENTTILYSEYMEARDCSEKTQSQREKTTKTIFSPSF